MNREFDNEEYNKRIVVLMRELDEFFDKRQKAAKQHDMEEAAAQFFTIGFQSFRISSKLGESASIRIATAVTQFVTELQNDATEKETPFVVSGQEGSA